MEDLVKQMMAQTQMLQAALAKQAQESREDRERAETKAREDRERAETKAREDRERLEAQLREERERAEERFAALLAKQTGLAPSEHEAKGRCIRILEKAEEDDRVATLDELKEECKKVDVFNTGMVGLSGQVASMNINAVNTRKPKRARQFRKPLNRYSENSNRNYGNFRPMQQGSLAGKNFNKFSSNKPSSYPKSKTLYCYGCGGKHYKSNCPYINTTCQKCHHIGHISNMCGQAPRAINLRSVSILDASLDSDNAALKKYPELTVDLQINSRPFAKMIIDTGADETILNEDTWQKLGSPPMQNTTKNVRAYGGGKYELLGSVLLDVSMQGSPPLQLTVYVVQGNLGHDLIGRPWLYELGLLSQHLKVQSYTTGPKGPQAPPILNPAIGQYIKTLHKEFPKVFEDGLADDRRQVANDQCRATMPWCGSRLSNCRSRNYQGYYAMSGYEIY
ncbi:gag-polyprotein putative aspartyl protease domain-containing protein [Ditylenchus destructor]|uniref:Gag-polyprotein putative aspartyl protease domain-containing protein n=1 Tax=Ditylenchus destructor TaxID=166010 RepID=A0AAD4MLB4_9BILA|nr:gag-polyprotein putative aspartyl protease domain-containing protein [Ditylenchus destructor]